jgi:hypothetical protein
MSGEHHYIATHTESILSAQQIFGICIAGIVGVTAIFLALVIGLFWHGLVRAVLLTRLKRDMIAAGYSPADVERVVRASPPEGRA